MIKARFVGRHFEDTDGLNAAIVILVEPGETLSGSTSRVY